MEWCVTLVNLETGLVRLRKVYTRVYIVLTNPENFIYKIFYSRQFLFEYLPSLVISQYI
jgi:hypothetical protein